MAPKLEADDHLSFLYICLQHTNGTTIDFRKVGSSLGINDSTARMRFIRLKARLDSKLADRGILASTQTSMSTRIGRKRNSRVKRRRIGATLRSDEDESLDSAAAEAPKVALTSQTPTNRRTRGKRIDFSAAFESDSDAEMVENECISDESFTGVRHDQERGLGELRSGKIIGMDGTSLTTARRVEPRMVSEPSKLKRLPSSETIQDHVPILDTPLEAKNAGKSGTSSDSRKISTEIPSTESSVNQTDVKMPGRQIKELNRADLITDLNELKTGMMIPLKHHLPVDATAAQITVSKITGTDANEVGNHCQIPPLSPGGTETLSRDIDEDRGSDDDTISPNESVTIVNPEARTVSKENLKGPEGPNKIWASYLRRVWRG